MSATTKPVLLLVPGVLNDARVWAEVTQALADTAEVRVAAPVQSSIAAMADAAWQQLDDIPDADGTRPLVLAGFSLGGYVVQEMLANPRRPVHAAALVSTSPRPESAETAAVREKTIAALGKNVERVVEGILQFATHAPSPALVDELRSMMLDVGAEVAIRQNRAILGRADHRAALAALRLPVAVLCGVHDRVTPPELSQELAALIPGAQLELIDGAGHMLPREQPRAVIRALRALLP